MYMDLLIVILLFSFLSWFILHIQDRRRILNGIAFFISFGSLLLIGLVLGEKYDIYILRIIVAFVIVGCFLMVPILLISLIIMLFSTGIKLIKKEGMSLSHSLSIALGLGMVLLSFIAPFIINKINSKTIKFVLGLTISFYGYIILACIIIYTSSVIYRFWFNKKNKDYLIVLGCGLNKDKVTPLLAARVDKAIGFYNKQKDILGTSPKIIVSGGQGPNELVSEAMAMKNYAISQGVPSEDIICEDKSRNTKENLEFSKAKIPSINKDTKIAFFTSNYHVFRAALISKDVGLKANGIGAPVKLYFYVSALIREYIAIFFMYKKLNIFFLAIILLINLLGVII